MLCSDQLNIGSCWLLGLDGGGYRCVLVVGLCLPSENTIWAHRTATYVLFLRLRAFPNKSVSWATMARYPHLNSLMVIKLTRIDKVYILPYQLITQIISENI